MPDMTTRAGFRLARAAIFAAVCVVTTALGHSMMGGTAPSAGTVTGAFAAATGGAWWLTGRERGATAVTGATIITQFVLHTLFTLTHAPSPMGSAPGTGGAHGTAGMDHAMHATHAMHTMPMSGASSAHGWTTGMVLAHTLAALLCGLWLWRGEAAVFRLGRALAAFVFAPLRRARLAAVRIAPDLPTGRIVTAPRAQRLRRSPLLHCVSRRGPPALPVCC